MLNRESGLMTAGTDGAEGLNVSVARVFTEKDSMPHCLGREAQKVGPCEPVSLTRPRCCTWVGAIPAVSTDWEKNPLRAALRRRTWGPDGRKAAQEPAV